MSHSLDGKSVLVAGGTSGAGLALAKAAAALGATVHLIGRSGEKLATAQALIGERAVAHQADIGDEAAVRALAARIGTVDHLVSTAAILTFKPFLEMSNGEMDGILTSKLWGPVYLVRHFAPAMTRDGSITFVSGSAAYKASAGGSMVAAANAAMDGLARTLAVELAPIRVNVVSPGVFDSATWDMLPAASRAQVLDSIGRSLPVGRVGTVDDIADAILFFINNGFASGTVLQVDGGANA